MKYSPIDLRANFANRLEEFISAARPGRLSLAVQLDGDPVFLEYEGPGLVRKVDGAGHPWESGGCLAKPITACLVAAAACSRQIDCKRPRMAQLLESSVPC